MRKLNNGGALLCILWLGLSSAVCIAEEPAVDDSEAGSASAYDGDASYRREIQQECESQAASMELEGNDRTEYIRLCLQQYGL